MADFKRALLAVTIVVVVLIVVTYGWYYGSGWAEFSYTTGDLPSWTPSGSNKDISQLRFRNCKFTVTMPAGTTGVASSGTVDVTAVLNRMAIAYRKGVSLPSSLTLVAPLNPFSFAIANFNDGSKIATQSPWCAKVAPCSQDSTCPVKPTVTGACNVTAQACLNCANGPTVTLVGKYRTI